MKKIAAAIVAAILVVGSVLSFANYKSKSEKKRLYLAAARSEVSSLMRKKSELQSTLENYESKAEAMSSESMTVTFFFDTLSENLIDDVYPLLNKYSYTATIVMKDGLLPGDDGCISRTDFDYLLRYGWDIAIGEPSSFDPNGLTAESDLADYLDSYMNSMRDSNINVPFVFCFDEGHYNKRFDSVLKQRGFTMLRRGTECNTLIETEDGLVKLLGTVICADKSTAQKYVSAALSMGTSVSVITGKVTDDPENSALDCTPDKYKLMLEYIKEDCAQGSVFTASELYKYYTTPKTVSVYEDEIRETEDEIARVEEEIQKIYDGLN